MKNNMDESKLTAYVLGELSAAEAAEVERAVAGSDDLQNELSEITETVRLLEQRFAAEAELHLTAEQRAAILAGRRQSGWFTPAVQRYVAVTAAACLMVAVFLAWPEEQPRFEPESEELSTSRPDMASSGKTDVSEGGAVTTAPERPLATETGQRAGDERTGGRGHAASPASASEKQAVLQARVADTKKDEAAKSQSVRSEASVTSSASGEQDSPLAPRPAENQFTVTALDAANRRVSRGAVGEVARTAMYPATTATLPDEIPPGMLPAPQDFDTEAYDRIYENEFVRVSDKPLSTFSIDVDTASYTNVRRFLNERRLPPKDAVRIEELVNYFDYDYPAPSGDQPFAVHVETASSPWNAQHLLVRFGLKGREISFNARKASNLVFLIDVSGSMEPVNKLPLLKRALRLMVDQLRENDRVAIVVYAGASGLVLPSTPCSESEKILEALEKLQAGGSTNGGAGIELAYKVAREHFITDGINRVVLATDGDFNVGVTNQGDLVRMTEDNAKSGIFLTVLGFGMGNYKDSTLEKLADRGNGSYAYIDTVQEARKVLVEQIGGTLMTIAKDVKIQVEFNPTEVNAYRLVGYENRLLRDQDFNDDAKDAGEIGAGHTVTVLYELVPKGVQVSLPPPLEPLKYQTRERGAAKAGKGELLTLKLRYKEPAADASRLIQMPVGKNDTAFDRASTDFRFAASVAGFGMLLRDSQFKGSLTFEEIVKLAGAAKGEDSRGYRAEFLSLVKKARALRDLDALDR